MKGLTKSLLALPLICLLAFGSGIASAQDAKEGEAAAAPAPKKGLDINKILAAANAGAAKDKAAAAAREKRFKAEKSKQQGRLNAMKGERSKQEKVSDRLDAEFAVNEEKIEQLQSDLRKELGDLKELFGVIQQTASEAQEDYKTSLISAQYPERAETLRKMVAKMASLTDLVSINELENLWFQLQNEMTEQGKIVKFTAPVTYVSGTEVNEAGDEINVITTEDREVTRVGVFNAIVGDEIATFKPDQGLTLLTRKMDPDYIKASQALQSASGGITNFKLDPSKGSLVSAFVQKPTLLEKVQEGGNVGYVIITLGIIAFLIALYRIIVLSGVESKVKKQANDMKRPSLKNPLGRVLKVYQDNPETDPETMELKLGEAILKESPKLNSMIMFIKIIAVVAPLLGLLGTVTGMIQTFQAITLFGAGDPQTMAGGISQALVTTVLGLVVAIPTVFMHWLASSRAKRIEETLEENASGLIAAHYDRHGS